VEDSLNCCEEDDKILEGHPLYDSIAMTSSPTSSSGIDPSKIDISSSLIAASNPAVMLVSPIGSMLPRIEMIFFLFYGVSLANLKSF